jgi:hypothetical protein
VNSLLQRYVATVVGFGFTAMWLSVGPFSAVMCLLGSAFFYCAVVVAQRQRLNVFTTRFVDCATPKRLPQQPRQSTPRERTPRATPIRERTEEPALIAAEYGW